EEVGLIGSQEFVKTYADSSIHLAMINLDVEGMGNAVYVGPVGGGDDDVLMPLVRKAAAGTLFFESEHYPSSDHLSFAAHRLENISVSVVPKGDAPLLIEAIEKNWQVSPDLVPEVLKLMHTPRDSSVYVSRQALEISFTVARNTLTLINDSSRP
ncbi:MAG TPA: M28 family peptidase, partial [Bacteroidota bacterium]